MTPTAYETFLRREAGHRLDVEVTLAELPPSAEPIDILLLFDATSSMSNVIDTVRSAAADIITEVNRLSSNAAFAVASFADYTPGDEPWSLHCDLSTERARVIAALAAISLQNGQDLPEAYSRALYEAQFLTWRPDSRRFIVLFGDAPAHDPDFYGADFGVDPGRDGRPGTADDLRLRAVVEQLRDRQLTVLAVHDSEGWFSSKTGLREAIAGFRFMAEHTGGAALAVASAGEVPGAIKAGLRAQFLERPVLLPSPEYASWVTVRPPEQIAGTARFRFPVELRAPAAARSGVHRFHLVARSATRGGSGTVIGRSAMRIRLGWAAFEWRYILAPLYVLTLLLALSRWGGGSRGGARLLWNRALLGLVMRLLLIAVLVAGLWGIWMYAPGALPPIAAE